MHRKTKLAFLFSLALILCLSSIVYAAPQVSGLVIDARGLGLERAMSPNIIDVNGKVLNAFPPADPNWVAVNGAVEYYTDATYSDVVSGKSRAGKNYIMVKAVSVKDFGRNVVISVDDANKLLDNKAVIDNIKKNKVVFLQ